MMSDDANREKHTKKSAPGKARRRRNVIFELPLHEYRTLQEDAASRGLDSINQRGREIIVDYLNNQPAEEAAERISAVEQELAGLREDIGHLEKLLRRLAFVTIAVSPEHPSEDTTARQSNKATEWVKKNMPQRENRR